MILRMGIDIAVRAPHQASLADERGELLWRATDSAPQPPISMLCGPDCPRDADRPR